MIKLKLLALEGKFTQEEVEKKIQKAKNLLLLTRRYDVSEKLIEKYLDKWDHNCWCFLSSNKMSESFIERHKDKVQWIVICMKQKMSYVEVPVRYKNRIGTSKVSGTVKGTIMAGIKIIGWIFKYAFK